MGIRTPSPAHFLVEWYRPAITNEPIDLSVARLIERAAAISASGSPVNLIATLVLASDEVVFAVFDSGSEQTVVEVCRQAGCPAQRVTPAVDARFWREESGSTS